MTKKRIVVTGMGLVSCFGTDIDQFYAALLDGKSAVSPIESFPCQDYPTRFGAEIKCFDAGDYIDKKQARRLDPFLRYALVAGKKALESSNLFINQLDVVNRDRCGILIGSGMGGMSVFFEGSETLVTKGVKRLTPFFIPYMLTNMAGGLLAIDTGFKGPNFSVSTACATSNFAIYSAAKEIRDGRADLMICGGAEAPFGPPGLGGFSAIGALSTRNDDPQKASRPWDLSRDGFVMGEGAGILILESLEHALNRNAPIFAEYLGGAVNCDAYHMTTPHEDGDGVANCMELAMKDAGVHKERINYVNAHATSTKAGDLCEIKALKKVFGSHLQHVKINATKSMIGHCLGAAGGLEAIAVIESIRKNMVHPTINLDSPEAEVDGLDLVAHKSQKHVIDVAFSNSFGFGGHNSTLVFAPYKGS